MFPDAPLSWGGNGHVPQEAFSWKQLSEIPVKPITWIEYPFLQGSAFHLLAGVKNSGKGTWLASVAARCTRGEFNPDGWPQAVLWLALGEDSYAIDVRPRIEVAGGDPSGVFVLDGYGFKLPEHGQELEQKVRDTRAAMVVIDPLGGTFGGGKSTNDDMDVRAALQSLNYLADNTGVMVFGVRHISNKAGKRGEGVLSGILGSSDWVNIPRSVLAVIHDDTDPSTRHLFAVTGNRGPTDTPGLMFRIEGAPIEGQEHGVSLARMLGESHKDPDELLTTKPSRRTSRSDAAVPIVLALLQEHPGGRMASDLVDAEAARRVGLSAKTIRNVRNEMRNDGLIRAVPEKDSEGGVIAWHAEITLAGVARLDAILAEGPLTPKASPLATPSTPTSFKTTRAREDELGTRDLEAFSLQNPTSRQNSVGLGSGDLQGFSKSPSGSGDLQGNMPLQPNVSVQPASTNGHHPNPDPVEFGLNTPDPPDPDFSESSGSGVVKPNPEVSAQQLPEWERAFHERRSG